MSQVPSNAGGLVGQRLGKYELLALLALGGTAEIYLARIGGVAGFEKYVVVKCLHDHLADDEDFVRMFLDEARLGAKLTHSNIVQTLELGEQQGRYYMVMEYLAGMSMAVVARKAAERIQGGRLPVDLVLGLMAQTCSGLHYAHNRADSSGQQLNIVHRDVSPQNLVVTFEGILKVVDFGIAKAAVRETQTQSGTIKGKFAYMSPEQCQGNPIDHRTDVFALGVVVHELLTGKRLFRRETAYDTYHAILECKVPPPSQLNHELDPALDDIVLKALAYDTDKRYQSAEELGEALTGVLHRRGKSVGASNVAQFFEEHFANEITEHGQRMRALISGRQTTTMDEYWNDLDESGQSSADEVAGADAGSGSGAAPAEPSEIHTLDSGLLVEEDDEDEDDGGGATRIELNPLERVKKLHEETSPRNKQLPERDEGSANNKKTTNYQATGGTGSSAAAKTLVPTALRPRAGTGGSPDGPSSSSEPTRDLSSGEQPRIPEQAQQASPQASPQASGDDSDSDDMETLIADRSPEVDQMLAAARAQAEQQQGGPPQPGPQGGPQQPGSQPWGGPPQPGQPGPHGYPGQQPGGPPQQPGGQWPGPPQQGYGMPHPMPEHGGYHGQNMHGGYMGQMQGQPGQRPRWLLTVIFLVCVGVGLGVTLFIASLI